MKVLEIASNTNGDIDGIGKHARLVTEELCKRKDIEKATLISGDTVGFSKRKMVTSLEMTKAFKKAENFLKNEHYDFVVIEYPFAEFNPFILFELRKLRAVCYRYRCHLALSMHEFDRVNPLRRAVIKEMLKVTDLAFVSEPKYLKKLKKYNSTLYLRTIPNHVPISKHEKKINNNFIYFGLINKSKAFYEMLEAWKIFNKNGQYKLYVLTATALNNDIKDIPGIELHYNLSDVEASNYMWKATYSIVPIVPSVGFNNSSFVSTIQCGCIPIGRFNDELREKPFVVHTHNYENEEFANALKNAASIGKDDILRMSDEAFEFGMQFTIEGTVTMMIDGMKKVLKETKQ